MSGGSPLQERTNLLRAEEDDDVRMVQTKTTSRSKKKEEGEDRECGVQDAASRAKEVVEGKTWSEKRVRSACDGLTWRDDRRDWRGDGRGGDERRRDDGGGDDVGRKRAAIARLEARVELLQQLIAEKEAAER